MILLPDDIPIPDVVESDSDTAWQEFRECENFYNNQFADTEPAPLSTDHTTVTSVVTLIHPDEDPFNPISHNTYKPS